MRGETLYVKGRKRLIDILFNLEHSDYVPFATQINDNIYDEDEDPETADAAEEDILKRTEQMAFVVITNRLVSRLQWVSVTEVLNNDSDAQFLKKCGIKDFDDSRCEKYIIRLKRLRDIRCYTYHVQMLESDKSCKEVTEIFVRVNSLGSKLYGSDLALAQISAKWSNSLKIFEDFRQECKEVGFDYDLGVFTVIPA